MSSTKSTAVTVAAIVVAAASMGFAGYEAHRAGELAGIAAEAHINADAAQRQYLASLEYRIARLEEGGQSDDGRDDDSADGQDGGNAPEYQKGMLQAAHRHARRPARHLKPLSGVHDALLSSRTHVSPRHAALKPQF